MLFLVRTPLNLPTLVDGVGTGTEKQDHRERWICLRLSGFASSYSCSSSRYLQIGAFWGAAPVYHTRYTHIRRGPQHLKLAEVHTSNPFAGCHSVRCQTFRPKLRLFQISIVVFVVAVCVLRMHLLHRNASIKTFLLISPGYKSALV
jgi:hypothetical protein